MLFTLSRPLTLRLNGRKASSNQLVVIKCHLHYKGFFFFQFKTFILLRVCFHPRVSSAFRVVLREDMTKLSDETALLTQTQLYNVQLDLSWYIILNETLYFHIKSKILGHWNVVCVVFVK